MADLLSAIDVTKSKANILTGTFQSKKFGLAAIWTVACLGFPAEIPAWTGAVVICAYVLGQSFVEGMAARKAGGTP